MTFKLKSLVVAAAFLAVGSAQAVTETVNQGGSLVYGDYTVTGLSGSGSLAFSQDLLDSLNLAQVVVTGVSPATATIDGAVGGYTAISASAPVVSVTGDAVGSNIAITNVGTVGGATQTMTQDGVDNGLANGTGYITIKDLSVDLVNQDVYATLIGDNGVGTQTNVKLWHYLSITGDTSLNLDAIVAAGGSFTAHTVLSNLQIYDSAFALLAQGVNLNDFGALSLSGVNNGVIGYGSITSDITVHVTKAAVPEPATYALMGLGLVGLGFVSRRKGR